MASNKHKGMANGFLRGLTVEVRNGNVDGAIRLLNRKVKNDGLIREIRKREYFEKPSVVKRRKKIEAINRQRKLDQTTD